MICRRIVVRGRVQGVGFRYSARTAATRLGVAGQARNRDDGSVEVVIEGSAASVDAMLEWLAGGPPGARVDTIEVFELTPIGASGFVIAE
ncbi:acylphosphatase [Leifsonia kafniensis]|uniref:acylphosphatase n=1 Tax=Leifsonia kafniensis TaxID=475957 RepID=A0ABP7KYW4_9MICO